MSDRPQHTIILPYFCREEVERYLTIAQRLAKFPTPKCDVTFLLASSPKTDTDQELVEAYSKLGKTIAFACPTQIFGYPEGPGAMFWDCMEYLQANNNGGDGFSLWLESDMAPVKPNWIDRLSDEWYAGDQTPVMMGCYVPEVYKHRIFKKPKRILEAHINGGACYALDFASHMPPAAREGVFDMAVFQFAQELGRARFTRQISFSTNGRVRRDIMDANKVLLHGFMQDKDLFVKQCLTPTTEAEQSRASWNETLDRWEDFGRRVKLPFISRGKQSTLENMFLEKNRYEREHPEAFRHQPKAA